MYVRFNVQFFVLAHYFIGAQNKLVLTDMNMFLNLRNCAPFLIIVIILAFQLI